MPTCEFCDDEFDTDRGLSVHKAQKHPEEREQEREREDKETVSAETTKGPVTFSLNIHYALIIAFTIGVLAGGFGMATLNAVSGTGAMAAPTQDTGDAGNGGAAPQNGDAGTAPDIPIDGEPVLGQEDAPVTLIVYEDFECPFCKRFEEGAGSQIVADYVTAGDVKIVWKDFPLTQIHPWARPAAEVMECVYRQDEDAFWAVKNTIFSNQNGLNQQNAPQQILNWAEQEGVSPDAVRTCVEDGDATQEVTGDMQEGRNLGVSGTPTVFINGQKIVGAQPYQAFKQVIDAELN